MRHPTRRRGAIFITAMWVTIVLVAILMVFARSMRVEVIASGNRLSTDQAAAVELGAEQYVLAEVDDTDGYADYLLNTAPGEAIPVGKGYFWLLRPNANETTWDFGLIDEASKVNLNVAKPVQLIQLPGMTSDVADSIVDWIDPDENVTNGDGAESSYYNSLPEPYNSKNQPMESVGELRLVKGVTDQVLYGVDANHNGVVEPHELSSGQPAATNLNGVSANRGIFPFVTVYTIDPNTDSNGMTRASINSGGNVVVAPGGGGPPGGGGGGGAPPGGGGGRPGGGGGGRAAPAPAPTGNGRAAAPGGAGGNTGSPLAQALQQAGLSSGRVQQIMQQAANKGTFSNIFDFANKVGMTSAELRQAADRLGNGRANMGLINVNTAPREVLLTIPGIAESDVDTLLGQRQRSDTTSIAWVAEALPMSKVATFGSMITNRSFFYSADIVAVSGDGRAFRRVRIVVDARQSPAKIVFRKDLTSQGWPLPRSVRDSLRAGQGPGASLQGTTATDDATSSSKGTL